MSYFGREDMAVRHGKIGSTATAIPHDCIVEAGPQVVVGSLAGMS